MPGEAWPMWSEAEIDNLALGYINDIIKCEDGYSAFAAVALENYLVNKIDLTHDN